MPKVGKGSLEIASAKPGFADVSDAGFRPRSSGTSTNDWPGHNKRFTIDMERAGRGKRLVKVTWSYDVDYGWNLFDRYSNLYIHGTPDAVVQYSLANVQTMLASVPNIVYDDLDPKLVDTPQTPVLFVEAHAKRNQTEIDYAKANAMSELQAAMEKLEVSPAGPRIVITKSYGENGYKFDVAVPISASTVSIDGKSYALTAPVQPSLTPATASSAPAAAASAASSAAPAAADMAKAKRQGDKDAKDGKDAKDSGPQPGSRDKYGHLIINDNVRGMLAFGGRALEGVWNGSPLGHPLHPHEAAGLRRDPRLQLEHRHAPAVRQADGGLPVDAVRMAARSLYDEQTFNVYLPVTNAPAQTPEQEAAAAASSAPAPASSSAPAAGSSAATASSAAAASSAPAEAASAN